MIKRKGGRMNADENNSIDSMNYAINGKWKYLGKTSQLNQVDNFSQFNLNILTLET